jgi:hypothetical protein
MQQLEVQRITLRFGQYKSDGYRPGNFLRSKSSQPGIGKVQEQVDTPALPGSTQTG